MTLRELKKIVDNTLRFNERAGDCEVVVKADRPSMGPIASDKVISAGKGIDWDRNLFIIRPEKQEAGNDSKTDN
jgi:hypothetical protein